MQVICELSQKIEEKKKKIKSEIQEYMIKPCIAFLQFGMIDDSSFLEDIEKMCSEVGMYFKNVKFDSYVTEKEILNKIIELNHDEYVNGIVLMPTVQVDIHKISNYVVRTKDVNGQTDANVGKTLSGKEVYIPSLVGALFEFLKEQEIKGKRILLIGDCVDMYLLSSLLLGEHAQVSLVGEGKYSIEEVYDLAINFTNQEVSFDYPIYAYNDSSLKKYSYLKLIENTIQSYKKMMTSKQ